MTATLELVQTTTTTMPKQPSLVDMAKKVDAARIRVADAQDELLAAQRDLNTVVASVRPFFFVTPQATSTNTRQRVPKGHGLGAWLDRTVEVGTEFELDLMGKRWAGEMGIQWRNSLRASLYNTNNYQRVSKGRFKRVA